MENDGDDYGGAGPMLLQGMGKFLFDTVIRSEEVRGYQEEHDVGGLEFSADRRIKVAAAQNAAIMP